VFRKRKAFKHENYQNVCNTCSGIKLNPPHKGPPRTIGGTLFLDPQGRGAIWAVINKNSALFPSFFKHKESGLLSGHFFFWGPGVDVYSGKEQTRRGDFY